MPVVLHRPRQVRQGRRAVPRQGRLDRGDDAAVPAQSGRPGQGRAADPVDGAQVRAQRPPDDRRVVGTAAEEGLELDYDRALNTTTLAAHRLIEVAGRQGLGEEMAGRLFRAYFTEGRDVADPGVLAELAAEAGVTDTGRGPRRAREQLARARSLGISGVPLFLFEGKYAVSGAQPVDTFAAAIDEVAERTGQTPITQLAAPAEGCDDDGVCAV